MMPTAARVPADLARLDRETGMLLATVDSLSEEELRGPSRCEGWSRAHVVAHLARNADALGRLIEWATTGRERPAYDSLEARERDIEEGAARAPGELKRDLRAACERFAIAARQLVGSLATEEVALRGRPRPARSLVALRITEVVLHHDDLATVWTLEEADPDAQLDALEEAVRRLDADEHTPALTLLTQEKDEFTLRGGGPVVRGSRDALLAWLARGRTDGVHADGDLPALPTYG